MTAEGSSPNEGTAAVTATRGGGGGGNRQRWFPLESNPTLMNSYVEKLGFSTELYEFVDVYSTEDWALEMIPQPVAAVIMLYPLTAVQEEHRSKETADVSAMTNEGGGDDAVWFTKQRIGNACGTIGLLHALLNTPEGIQGASIRTDSWLHAFRNETPPPLDPVAKAERLENDAVIATLHDEATSDATLNQTSRGNLEDRVMTHFCAFVNVKGRLYELDGRKDGPIRHNGGSDGATTTTGHTLLRDACRVVEQFMKRDPGEMRFTILALAPKQQQEP